MAGYPVTCFGMTFNKGAELHDWVDSLYSRRSLSSNDRNALYHLYDKGLLAHFDFKHLSKKPVIASTAHKQQEAAGHEQ